MTRDGLGRALLLLVCGILVSCSTRGREPATPTPIPAATPAPKPTYVVQRGDVQQQIDFQAQVAALTEQQTHFGSGGRVKEILVGPGEAVTAGQVLASLDVAEAEQALAAARAELDMLERDAQRALRKAELALQIAQRTVELYKAQERPDLEIEIAQLQLELARLGVDEVKDNSDLRSRRARVAELEATIAGSSLLSPADTHVLEVLVVPGRVVDTSTAILSLGDPAVLEVRAWLPSEKLQGLAEGMPVSIQGGGQALAGSITALPPPQGQGTDSAVHISLETSAEPTGTSPELGESVSVQVALEQRENALWLPPQAVSSIAGRTFVIVQAGDAQRTVDVEIGLVTPQRVEIVEGLAEGQVVIGP